MRMGIDDPDLARSIIRMMIDDHNEMLAALANETDSNLIHVDLRPLVGDEDWWDELHLRPDALRRVGARFAEELERLVAIA